MLKRTVSAPGDGSWLAMAGINVGEIGSEMLGSWEFVSPCSYAKVGRTCNAAGRRTEYIEGFRVVKRKGGTYTGNRWEKKGGNAGETIGETFLALFGQIVDVGVM